MVGGHVDLGGVYDPPCLGLSDATSTIRVTPLTLHSLDFPRFPLHVHTGTLCLDIIQDQWSAIQTVSMVLTSIQSLLNDPNPASPANPEAAKLFETDKKTYRRRIRQVAERSLEAL